MPKFQVELIRHLTQTATVEIEAKSEGDASIDALSEEHKADFRFNGCQYGITEAGEVEAVA